MQLGTKIIVPVIVVSLLIFAVLINQNEESPKKSVASNFEPIINIRTAPIPILVPHTHDLGESVADIGHGVYINSEPITVPQDSWVISIEPVIENAPYSTMHHLMIEILDTKDALCPNLHEKMIVVGPDSRKVIPIPPPYGIFLKKDTQIRVLAMLHNPEPPLGTGEAYYEVTAGFKLGIANALDTRTKHLSFYVIGVDDPPHCEDDDDYTFTVPPHSAKFVKASDDAPGRNDTYMKFPEDGMILKMGSHIHGWQGSKRLDVFLNNQLLRSLLPEKISDVPDIWTSADTDVPQAIKAGDVLTISTEYENKSSIPTRGAMGMLGFYFSPN